MNHCIHHIDGNLFNSLPENLMEIDISSHAYLHNKGKTLTTEHKKMISINNKKRHGVKIKKRIKVDLLGLYIMLNSKISINKIAKNFNCNWSTIRSRIKENPELLKGV